MATLQHFRANNFGREILTMPLDEDTLGSEIDAYNAEDATNVSKFMRQNASLDTHIDQIEAALLDAVDRFQLPDTENHRKALSTYLALHLPRGDELSPRHERSLSGFNVVHRVPGLAERLDAAEKLATTVNDQFAARDRQFAAADQRLTKLEQWQKVSDERLTAADQQAQRLATSDERLAELEAKFLRNEPLIIMLRPFAMYARKLPWLRKSRPSE
jgi:exonuclease VII large subunit